MIHCIIQKILFDTFIHTYSQERTLQSCSVSSLNYYTQDTLLPYTSEPLAWTRETEARGVRGSPAALQAEGFAFGGLAEKGEANWGSLRAEGHDTCSMLQKG